MSEKVHEIFPSFPVTAFYNLSTQDDDLFLCQDYTMLGFDGIDYIDNLQYNPILDEVKLDSIINNVFYVDQDIEKVKDEPSYSFLTTSENNFLRTQDGNFFTI